MTEIYLTGAVTSWQDPWEWHREIKEEYDEHKFINPFMLNKYGIGDDEVYARPEEVVEPALEKIEEVDGMLIRYDDESNLMGSAMEILHAYRNGIPVVIWNVSESDRRVSPWLLYHTRHVETDRDQAMKCLLMYAGESAEDVIGKPIVE